jgi:hypothetical protein
MAQALGSPAWRVVIVSRATEPIEGSASPRNPSVALDREIEVGAGHSRSVVGDADQPPPAAVGCDLDPGRAGVERVLDEFLDHARRALDHLACGDAVDRGFRELADGHCCSDWAVAGRPDSLSP